MCTKCGSQSRYQPYYYHAAAHLCEVRKHEDAAAVMEHSIVLCTQVLLELSDDARASRGMAKVGLVVEVEWFERRMGFGRRLERARLH